MIVDLITLYQLSVFLDKRLALQPCDHTLRFTRTWLRVHDHNEMEATKYLLSRGADCDCAVLAIASQPDTNEIRL